MADDLDIRDTTTDIDTDVVVVGARCAGAATAMLLARQGIDVVVVDRVTELGNTLSTHLISRGGVVGGLPSRPPEPAPMIDVTPLGTILGIWAHPDDETYLSGGLMAQARNAGQRVVCVTATRGEHGTGDPVSWPPRRLAELRAQELTAALDLLGVVEHHWLEYEDGTLPEVDADAAIGRICALIELVQPDTIVTFGPEGMTGHADHRTIAAWTLSARQAVAPDARLLQATTTAGYAQRFAKMLTEIPIFDAGLPLRTPETDLALRLQLRGPLLDRKVAALRAQASQTDAVVDAMGLATYRSWVSEEAFVEPVTVTEGCRCGAGAIHVPSGT